MRVLNSILFSQHLRRGVFQVVGAESLSNLKQESEQNEFQYIELDGSTISTKIEVFNALENGLQPATTFGINWDELEFQLRALDWITSSGVTIVYKHFQVFQQTNPEDFAIFLDIIYSAIHMQTYIPQLSLVGFYFIFQSDDFVELPPMKLTVPYLVPKR